MKKNLFLIFVMITIALLGFSEGILGLRTVKATETETPLEQETNSKLNLRTVDPLLKSFRDGFKLPGEGWTSVKLGEKEINLPFGFTLNAANSGMNYDAEILDENRKQFAQLFMYQIEEYKLEELYQVLVDTLYPGAAGEKIFEEFKEYENGLTVYFTNQINTEMNAAMPVFFIYTKDEDKETVKEGTALFLFVEPFEYVIMEDPAYINAWVEGIVASQIESMKVVDNEVLVKKEENNGMERGSDTDSFGAWVRDSVKNQEWVDDLPDGWIEKQATTFSVFHPEDFIAQAYMTDSFELIDFEYDNTAVAKLFVGFSAEQIEVSDVLEELYETYLSGLGDYTLVKETPYMTDMDGFLTTYELEFEGIKCWVTITSESDTEYSLEGEYILFLGIASEDVVEAWKLIYHTMLLSVSF